LSLSEEAALEQELKAQIQNNDVSTANNQPLESMASTGHDINDDINEISDTESEAELENTQPSDIALKLT